MRELSAQQRMPFTDLYTVAAPDRGSHRGLRDLSQAVTSVQHVSSCLCHDDCVQLQPAAGESASWLPWLCLHDMPLQSQPDLSTCSWQHTIESCDRHDICLRYVYQLYLCCLPCVQTLNFNKRICTLRKSRHEKVVRVCAQVHHTAMCLGQYSELIGSSSCISEPPKQLHVTRR